MEKQTERMARTVQALKEIYPEARCALLWGEDPWRLLVMGRLSAQCTDRRVNEVAGALFAAYPDVYAMAAADEAAVGELIRSCGLYRMKAHDLVTSAKQITEEYGGELPRTMEGLLTLSGVGRKIANLLLGDVWGEPSVVTDTHCIRICGRLGFYPESEKNPPKIEKILREVLDPAESTDFCHRIVDFGRDVCRAQNPLCETCLLRERGLCAHADAVGGR